jgi:hypothetical protein
VNSPDSSGAHSNELWKRENAIGIALPPPDEATELIIAWLESGQPNPATAPAETLRDAEIPV